MIQDIEERRYRVQHLAESDGGGGAMMAAHRLHTELRNLGVDSHMLVADKRTDDSASVQLQLGKDPVSYLRRRVRREIQKRRLKQFRHTKSKTLEMFTHGKGMYGGDLVRKLPSADVYALHWSDRLIDYHSLFAHIEPCTPVVWRLPDMSAMTGGCHYAWDCDRFAQACGACPQLGSGVEQDLSRRVFKYKQAAYAQRDPNLTCFVAPSRWIALEASRSQLLRRFSIVHIPTGVDCNRFRPMNSLEIRQRHGLPADKPLALFVSHSVSNHRKGFDLLAAALREMPANTAITLAAIGEAPSGTDSAVPCRALGRIDDPDDLAALYAAADLFVHPAREENFPNVVLEAMACGTPIVAFDAGGVPELVRSGETGLLVPRENVTALRQSISDVLADSDNLRAMSHRCRAVVLAEYRQDQMAERYRDLFESLLNRAGTCQDGV